MGPIIYQLDLVSHPLIGIGSSGDEFRMLLGVDTFIGLVLEHLDVDHIRLVGNRDLGSHVSAIRAVNELGLTLSLVTEHLHLITLVRMIDSAILSRLVNVMVPSQVIQVVWLGR